MWYVYGKKSNIIVLLQKGLQYTMCTLSIGKSSLKIFSGHYPFIPFIFTLLSYIFYIYAIYTLRKPILVLYVLFRSKKVHGPKIWYLGSNIYFEALQGVISRWDTASQNLSNKIVHENDTFCPSADSPAWYIYTWQFQRNCTERK